MTTSSHNVTHDDAFIVQCEADYSVAEITALAHMAPGEGMPTHLLAVVELLHAHLEPNPIIGLDPKSGGYPRRVDLGARAGKLFIQRWHLPVREGIQWYRSCANGSMTVPGSNPSKPSLVQLGRLGDDPPWPNLVVEIERFWPKSEFWGNRPGGSRWHRLIPLTVIDITRGWIANDFERARDFFMSEVHVDLLSRSVLLGSCHLRLPNPVFRELHQHVGDDWRSVTFDLELHAGQTIDELELIFWNQRSWGASSVRQMTLKPGTNVIHLPESVEQVGHAVFCRKRGLLKQSELAGFIGSIGMTMNFVSEERRVETPKGSYTVGVSEQSEPVLVGTPRSKGALVRLAEDEVSQRTHKAWAEIAFRWFDNDSVAGTQAIRDIIQSASRSVDLLDPYFGRGDLLEFALSTTKHGLPFRVLTSHDFCTSGHDPELKLENGDALAETLESVRAQDPRLNIEIKVMPGQKSPVHDRFLIVDGTVWVLGASLNEFGSRGSLLMKLPPPPALGPHEPWTFSVSSSVFEAHWQTSSSMHEWRKKRAEVRKDPGKLHPAAHTFGERMVATTKLLKDTAQRVREIWHA
ncbi:VPA1262 family N-terminal domain-containing protein [Pseudomonas syringae pv. tagetis]|nr:VPA1262 family N-terminal domain-containing protein [Pseudomonas syringae group genomosp. 7]UNB68597.1 phospholipase D family protein [Pseudomonas syringae pv. tagetis]